MEKKEEESENENENESESENENESESESENENEEKGEKGEINNFANNLKEGDIDAHVRSFSPNYRDSLHLGEIELKFTVLAIILIFVLIVILIFILLFSVLIIYKLDKLIEIGIQHSSLLMNPGSICGVN